MGTPSWQPLPFFDPETNEPPLVERARARANHRAIMAMRWRNQEARAEDRKLGRLPYDWHEWMGCPHDQYGAKECTCDRDMRNQQHPSVLRQRERAHRAKLASAPSGAQDSACVHWVESIDTTRIDTSWHPGTMPGHDTNSQKSVDVVAGSPALVGPHRPVRDCGPSAISRRGRRRGFRSQERKRLISISARLSARRRWIHQQTRAGFGRYLPRVLRLCVRGQPLAPHPGERKIR